MTPRIVKKVFVYLVRDGSDLLLLSHSLHPEAGLQVPAGTIMPGEDPRDAARRELVEETGLVDFEIKVLLGERIYDMRPFGKDELHHRYFFHAALTGEAPERWRHEEVHAETGPIPLELFWWDLHGSPPDLIVGHGEVLGALDLT